MSYPLNIFALVGCQTPDEFKANMAASEVRLTDKEMAWLELKSDSR
jgi:aryl-alcohol dehydrogenase-like predicted oxidoreductase